MRDRAKCSVCGRIYQVRVDGRLREHHNRRGGIVTCPGSRELVAGPRPSELLAARVRELEVLVGELAAALASTRAELTDALLALDHVAPRPWAATAAELVEGEETEAVAWVIADAAARELDRIGGHGEPGNEVWARSYVERVNSLGGGCASAGSERRDTEAA